MGRGKQSFCASFAARGASAASVSVSGHPVEREVLLHGVATESRFD